MNVITENYGAFWQYFVCSNRSIDTEVLFMRHAVQGRHYVSRLAMKNKTRTSIYTVAYHGWLASCWRVALVGLLTVGLITSAHAGCG